MWGWHPRKVIQKKIRGEELRGSGHFCVLKKETGEDVMGKLVSLQMVLHGVSKRSLGVTNSTKQLVSEGVSSVGKKNRPRGGGIDGGVWEQQKRSIPPLPNQQPERDGESG